MMFIGVPRGGCMNIIRIQYPRVTYYLETVLYIQII